MEKNNSFLLRFALLLGVVLAVASCVKKDDYYSAKVGGESNRKQVVQINGADELIQYARDVDPIIDTFIVVDLRRYPNSESELNSSLTVKLAPNPTAISDYNTANGTSFVELPANAYTLLTDINNVTFAPGEAIKEIKIRLDKNKISLSDQYALAFKVSDPGSGAVVNQSLGSALYSIGVKNKWDGIYSVTGSYVDMTNGAFTGVYPYTWELQTNGPTSCVVVDNENLGFPGFTFYTGSGYSYYGNFGLIVNFDPDTNAITSITNYYGQPAANTRSAQLDPTGENRYDETSKTIKIKYFMLQPSVVTAPPNIRAKFDETWTYTGPR